MSQFVSVAKAQEIPPGEAKVFEAGGRQIAVFNVDGKFYAIDNVCVHRGGPLGEGELQGTLVTCPWHAWTYDITTGVCQINPAARVDTFEVRVENGEIQVAV